MAAKKIKSLGKRYNLDIMSSLTDRIALSLINSNIKEFCPGEGLDSIVKENIKSGDFLAARVFSKAKKSGKYQDYPFDLDIAHEIRARFLMKLDESDSLNELWEECLSLLPNYLKGKSKYKLLSKDCDSVLEKIKRAFSKADLRLRKSSYSMINPASEKYESPKVLSEKEAIHIGLEPGQFEDIVLDTRNDGHDVLALKELVLIMRGEPVDRLTFGPGFFGKFMKELCEEGIHSLIFKVEKNRLSEIVPVYFINSISKNKVLQRDIEKFEYHPLDLTSDGKLIKKFYSPVGSSLALSQTYQYDAVEKECKLGSKKFKSIKAIKKKEVSQLFCSETRYYVVVNGTISGPSDKMPINYECFSNNNLRIPAGEVFLFEEISRKVVQTRIYFTPFEYEHINPIFHHGSICFGSNDQSFHSTTQAREYTEIEGKLLSRDPYLDFYRDGSYREKDESGKWVLKAQYKQNGDSKIGGTLDEKEGYCEEPYSDSVIFTRINYFPEKRSEQIFSGGFSFDSKANKTKCFLLLDVMCSLPGISKFTQFYHGLSVNGQAPFFVNFKKDILELSKFYAPFTHRWCLKQYLIDGAGLTLEVQPTYIKQLAQKLKQKDVVEFIRNFNVKNKAI